MTYPLSSDVTAGQPTAADHYNFLRADSLRFGQSAGDSANLGEMIARWEASNLTITILGTDRVRVPCSSLVPVAFMVNGYLLRSVVNVDLSSGGKPNGGAAIWYVFANRVASNTAFTITVNTSPTEGTDQRLIGQFWWDGTAIQAPSIRTAFAQAIKSLIGYNPFVGCQGRLSFLNNLVSFGDSNGSVLYLVPYKGNLISFYTAGFGWNAYPIPTTSPPTLTLSSLNTGKCYDVFAYWDGSTVQLAYLAWTNLVSRATALTYQDGVYTLSTDQSRLYLGTFKPSSASNVNDSNGERGLWNFFNRVQKYLTLTDGSSSWTYNSTTWRVENAAATLLLVTKGIAEDADNLDVICYAQGGSGLYGTVGIGIDANNANSAQIMIPGGYTSTRIPTLANWKGILGIGCHSIYWLECIYGSGTVTFYGQPDGSQYSQSGLVGLVWC